jgi:DNA-binding IclR family transcriptional regulator
MTRPHDSYYSTSLKRGLDILALFTENRTNISLSEISRELQLNKTSCFRFANTLVKLGYLDRDPRTRRLMVGLKAFTLGQNLEKCLDLIQIIRPTVDESYDRHNCSIAVALFHEETLLVVYRRIARDALTFQLPTVMRELHACALGKAVLAYLDGKSLSRLLDRGELTQRTKNTICSKRLLLADLDKTRKRGYSLTNEEYILGIVGIGAPLVSPHSKTVMGAISFDFATAQYSIRSIQRDYHDAVKRLAEDISRVLPMRY